VTTGCGSRLTTTSLKAMDRQGHRARHLGAARRCGGNADAGAARVTRVSAAPKPTQRRRHGPVVVDPGSYPRLSVFSRARVAIGIGDRTAGTLVVSIDTVRCQST
jgi:hypothetical protein